MLLALECLQDARFLAQRYRLGLCLIAICLEGPWLEQLVDHFTHAAGRIGRRRTADGLFQLIHIRIVGSLCLAQFRLTHRDRRALLAFLNGVKLALLRFATLGGFYVLRLSLRGVEAALGIAIGLLHGDMRMYMSMEGREREREIEAKLTTNSIKAKSKR